MDKVASIVYINLVVSSLASSPVLFNPHQANSNQQTQPSQTNKPQPPSCSAPSPPPLLATPASSLPHPLSANPPLTLQKRYVTVLPIQPSHHSLTSLKQTAKSVDQTLSAKAVSGIEKGEELAQKAKEAAGMSAAEAESKAKEVAGQAQGKAQELKGKAQGTAAELEGQAKSTAAQAEGQAKSAAAQADGKAKANGLK